MTFNRGPLAWTAVWCRSGRSRAYVISLRPHMTVGPVCAMAVSGKQRMPAMRDLPTIAELGVPGFELEQWDGVVTTGNTPPATVSRLSAAIAAVVRAPDVASTACCRWIDPGRIDCGAVQHPDSQRDDRMAPNDQGHRHRAQRNGGRSIIDRPSLRPPQLRINDPGRTHSPVHLHRDGPGGCGPRPGAPVSRLCRAACAGGRPASGRRGG
jgi:hypothetical protein